MLSSDAVFPLGLIAVFPLLILMILVLYYNVVRPFLESDEYIKLEIGRAGSEREKRYWKRELKKLYVSMIPFLGEYLARHM